MRIGIPPKYISKNFDILEVRANLVFLLNLICFGPFCDNAPDLKILDKYEISSRRENLVKVGARLVGDGEASLDVDVHVHVEVDG